MKAITKWISTIILPWVPRLDLAPIPAKQRGRLRLTPQQLLQAIHAYALAVWALEVARRIQRPALAKGPGGRPRQYSDATILLMAVVQTLWRKSYRQIVDWVATDPALAQALGFPQRDGHVHTISQGQYWERRIALGVSPFFFFFLGLVAQLIRLGVIIGKELIVDSTLLKAWYHEDPGAAWQKYAGKPALFGYKVHVVLCRQSELPLFVLVTPANVHDTVVGWLIVLVTAMIYALRVWVVYADAAYFDRRFFRTVFNLLKAHPAVDYNLRRSGKRKLASPFFVSQWQHLVLGPRSAIERHFAWAKRYFGLKYFQCFTLLRVTQYVLLTYIAIVAIALAAQRHQRPDLIHRRSMVLAHV